MQCYLNTQHSKAIVKSQQRQVYRSSKYYISAFDILLKCALEMFLLH